MQLLLFSNLFIAAGAVGMAVATDLLLGVPVDVDALLPAIFCATLVVYNLDRLVDQPEHHVMGGEGGETGKGPRDEAAKEPSQAQPSHAGCAAHLAPGHFGHSAASSDRHDWIERHRPLLWIITGAAVVGLVVTVPLLSGRVLLALAPLALLSIAYTFPVLGRLPRSQDRLREIAGLKAFLIAGIWTGVTALLPALDIAQISLRGGELSLVCIERFLFVLAITLPFDVRDRHRDAAVGIRTLPVILGIVNTRRLALGLMFAFAAISAVHYLPDRPAPAAAMLATAAVTAALLARLSPTRGDYYYSLALDGTLILQTALLALAAVV